MYKVKPSDLKGQIKDFPIEVVQKMVERQYEQIGKCNVKIFQLYKRTDNVDNGFLWRNTIEGYEFWRTIIDHNNFDVFFEKYPTRTTCTNSNYHYYIKKTSENKINDIIAKLVSLGGKSTKNYRKGEIYYISPKTHEIRQCDNDSIVYDFLTTFYTETFVDEVYEYTMDEIAEKLGIDVKQLKIKK